MTGFIGFHALARPCRWSSLTVRLSTAEVRLTIKRTRAMEGTLPRRRGCVQQHQLFDKENRITSIIAGSTGSR
jgi:hypothetical protein